MSYQVLARKWRPQTFSDVVGQEHVLTALTNGLSLGRVHHAYLFSGTRGVGKTTIARLLAKGLNCETGITSSPCGRCANCLEIEQGRFVDLIEIDAASRTKVEDTRDLLDNVQYAPARGRFKVYLIDEVHMLSRHSFNALLKTLEEPPAHVKFLLATTDPQKLPVTILSRCLQFHLKALDVGQISAQLEHILAAESIVSEPRALRLLARAADGSLRDALSLTDQAIAMGMGSVTAQAVSDMLGTLDSEQPLALIEALAAADGNAMMALLAQCVSRGVDWETLLVEMLTLLHRIAMGQLLPDALEDDQDAALAPRLRELARTISPADVQLYYQTLLVGRKELPFAPDARLGVEMTLLRALAFHPLAVDAAPVANPSAATAEKKTADSAIPALNRTISRQIPPETQASSAGPPPPEYWENAGQYEPADFGPGDIPDDLADGGYAYQRDESQVTSSSTDIQPLAPAAPPSADNPAAALPDSTAQLLRARTALLQRHANQGAKNSGSVSSPGRAKPVNSALERLATVSEQAQQRQPVGVQAAAVKTAKPEAYRWKASTEPAQASEPVATPKALRTALEHEKTPELAARLAVEAVARDPWAAQVDNLHLPKLVQQLALNAFREDVAPGKVNLHLRSSQQHLNSPAAQEALAAALSTALGAPVELTVTTDDNPAVRTPLEWRQAIYEEKLMQARQAIIADNNIQTLQRFFDADLDEDSIRPV